ncbi:hypothetical protein J4429_01675 [Candidatus Pacearchaeota archaeon]|nr:hypothetical protein [Candidatus Pacearchaeota archaeon]
MIRQTFRKIVATGLMGIVGFLGGCSTIPKPEKQCSDSFIERPVNISVIDREKADNACKEIVINHKRRVAEPSQGAYVTGYASGNYATKFLQDYRVLGRGPVAQGKAFAERRDNFIKGDSIHIEAFGNYDVNSGNLVEADFNAEAKKPIFFWENLVGGYDNPNYGDFAIAGYQFKQYQNGLLGTNDHHDHVLNAGFLHSSKVNLKLDWLHLLPDADIREGDLFRFTGSKKLQLGQVFDRDFCIDPFISAGYAHNWYGINGFTAVNSGVDVTFEKNHTVIGGKVECQSSLNDNVDNVLYAGAEVGFKF